MWAYGVEICFWRRSWAHSGQSGICDGLRGAGGAPGRDAPMGRDSAFDVAMADLGSLSMDEGRGGRTVCRAKWKLKEDAPLVDGGRLKLRLEIWSSHMSHI